jgi:AraC-like DNA-binding protein
MRFLDPKDIERKKILEEVLNRKCLEKLFDTRENGNYHYSYREEQKLFDAIKFGNLELADILIEELILNGNKNKDYNSISKWKSLCIIVVTLAARAAIEGGIPEDIAFALNESYVDIIDNCNSKDEIKFIEKFSINDFTKKVICYRKRKYSRPINESINYIQKHIHEKITTDDLAKITGLSTRQLARKFKSELSCTIIEYIQCEKINLAKKLLKFSKYSILEIGYFLDFCSQSYFISTFRKYEGVTPTQYREDKKKDTLEFD